MRRALVVGCGQRVWQDVETALQLCAWDAFYVVNLAGVHWPHGHFIWVTLHPEHMNEFERQRRDRGMHANYEVVVPPLKRHDWSVDYRVVSYIWDCKRRGPQSGSSSLFAVKVALHDDVDRIVLAGVPMTPEPHFCRRDRHGNHVAWKSCAAFYRGWQIGYQYYHTKTRSLSGGWTEKLLGAPTRQWLEQ